MFNEATQSSVRTPQAPGLPLSMVREGDSVCVMKLTGSQEVKLRLSQLGFVEGAQATIISKTSAGDVIVSIKGARIALDRKSSAHILTNEI